MDRADLPDYTKAILAGMENTNRIYKQHKQLLNLQDVLQGGAINKALDFVQPYLQEYAPQCGC